jgi:hypothetical protein
VCVCAKDRARRGRVANKNDAQADKEGTRHVAGDVVQTLGYDLRSGQCQVPISISVAIEVVESRVHWLESWAGRRRNWSCEDVMGCREAKGMLRRPCNGSRRPRSREEAAGQEPARVNGRGIGLTCGLPEVK